MSKAQFPKPSVKRVAESLIYGGQVYVPKNPPSKFSVGSGSWLTDEGDLRVRKVDPLQLMVSFPEDSQIISPPPEVWVRRTGYYDLLLRDDLV